VLILRLARHTGWARAEIAALTLADLFRTLQHLAPDG